MMTLKIALRNIFRYKARSLITLSAIVFGCLAMIFVGGFFEDLFIQLRENYIRAQVGHIQIYKRGFSENGRVSPYGYLIDNPDEVEALVETIPEVKFITSRLQFSGLISTGDNTVTFLGQGIEPDKERQVSQEQVKDLRKFSKSEDSGLPVVDAGQALVADDVYEVVLGKGLAASMSAKIDMPITVLTATVGGSTNALDLNVKGFFFTSIKDYDDIFLRIPLKTAQNLLNTQSVQSMVIKLNRTEDTDKVFKSLQALIVEKKMDLEIKRWEELTDFYKKTVELFDAFYFIMRLLVAITVVLGIFNTMNMAVMERISEIGTIMALGTRRSGVIKLFLLEGLCLGTVGGLIGVIVSVVIVTLFSFVGIVMPPPPGGNAVWLSTPDVIPSILVSTFFLSVLVGVISSVYPAVKASRLDITTALRYR